MSVQKTFIITLEVSSYNQHLLETPLITDNISDCFKFTSLTLNYLTEFRPANYTTRLKIATIKEVRTILNLSLRDAKHIVDMAQEKGEFKWQNITVTYNGDETFCVAQS